MTSTTDPKRVLELCDQALALDASERTAFIDHACDGDPDLRRRVDSVLLAVRESDEFLSEAAEHPSRDLIGRRIGDYTIVRKLGEGGMGSVFFAQRRTPDFEQDVAIKIARGPVFLPELVQRFDAERKILAGLRHPYIAQLIDGGTTEDGIAYLVMEYVEGVPIDEFCDARRLSLKERLRLVQRVATAVQAAHRNLIVHRDLKPSNVMVTADGIPKLLDFGIAKLVDPATAGSGHTTIFGHQALTPAYASPEQVLHGRISTVSDVYSLGILTYELLVGQRPYALPERDHGALIRSMESLSVSLPSTRAAGADDRTRLATASRRSTSPARLVGSLKGDLDRILLRALHPEPDRRYESMAAFRADIGRFLDGLPVEAQDDTLGYRARKFVARNKLAMGAAASVLLALVVGLGVALWQAGKARDQARNAQHQLERAEAVSAFLGDMLLSPSANWDAAIQLGADASIGDLLDAAGLRLEDDLTNYPGVRVELFHKLGEACGRLEKSECALRAQDKALEIVRSELPPSSPLLVDALYYKAEALGAAGRFDESVALHEQALAEANRQSPDATTLRKLYIFNDAAVALASMGEFARALDYQEQAFAGSAELFGDQILPLHTNGYHNLSRYQYELGRIGDARESVRLGLQAHALYADQTRYLGGLMYVSQGRLHVLDGRRDEALESFRQAAELLASANGPTDEDAVNATLLHAIESAVVGRTDEASDRIEWVVSLVGEQTGDDTPWLILAARAHVAGQLAEHESARRLASEALRKIPADDETLRLDRIMLHGRIAQSQAAIGNTADAEAHRAQADRIALVWLGDSAAMLQPFR